MRSGVTFPAAYGPRIEAVADLLAATERRVSNTGQLRASAFALDTAATRYGDTRVAVVYSAFAELIRTVAMLVDWRAAVFAAAPDADRYLRSAKELHRAWLEEYGQQEAATALSEAAKPIESLSDLNEVGAVCRAVGSVPLPVGLYAAEAGRRVRFRADDEAKEPPPPELTVAFIQFNVDGQPAGETHFLTPREAHDLEIEVRISRWPQQATSLRLAPVTIESEATHDFPTFRFSRPQGDPPYRLKNRQRALLKVSQGLRAHPFEFRYAADFEPEGVEQPVAVVGHRNLRVDSIERPITGYQGVDGRLLEIRDVLRQRPLITREDVTNTLMLAAALGNLAGQAVQNNLFPQPLDEPAFHSWVRGNLRQRPDIGSRLDEHPKAAGGTTDLSFCGIRLELKSDNERPLRLADCERFIGQTASYAAGSDKRVAVLCVLDGSRKVEQPFPAEDGIGVLKTADDAVTIVTVLVQGNLARPSDLTRRAPRRRENSPLLPRETTKSRAGQGPPLVRVNATDCPAPEISPPSNPRSCLPSV
jgi:hypothetical protein